MIAARCLKTQSLIQRRGHYSAPRKGHEEKPLKPRDRLRIALLVNDPKMARGRECTTGSS
jgi:hypothetical protein